MDKEEASSGTLTRQSDRDFLVSIGVEPYEPDLYDPEVGSSGRDRLIQALAMLQVVAIAAALVWTSM